jgi:hypothetical protein
MYVGYVAHGAFYSRRFGIHRYYGLRGLFVLTSFFFKPSYLASFISSQVSDVAFWHFASFIAGKNFRSLAD